MPKTQNISLIVLIALFLVLPDLASAHCDTLDGPVIQTARTALESKDVTPLLKWVTKEHEQEIRFLFKKTLKVRVKGQEAKELADTHFFETLVRLHRAGEGAPYTGLKPAGDVDPAVAAADKALETDSVDGLVKALVKRVEKGIRARFAHTREKKKHATVSIDAGREFVAAYVEFTHYVERLHLDAFGGASHHTE